MPRCHSNSATFNAYPPPPPRSEGIYTPSSMEGPILTSGDVSGSHPVLLYLRVAPRQS